MLKDSHAFSGFAAKDLGAIKDFYSQKLGVPVEEDPNMGLTLKLADGNDVFVYQKDDHAPANFTILNFVVSNIDEVIDELVGKGVTMERYENMPFEQDEKGVARGLAAGMGPDIAWFKDPAGNVLSILQAK